MEDLARAQAEEFAASYANIMLQAFQEVETARCSAACRLLK